MEFEARPTESMGLEKEYDLVAVFDCCFFVNTKIVLPSDLILQWHRDQTIAGYKLHELKETQEKANFKYASLRNKIRELCEKSRVDYLTGATLTGATLMTPTSFIDQYITVLF